MATKSKRKGQFKKGGGRYGAEIVKVSRGPAVHRPRKASAARPQVSVVRINESGMVHRKKGGGGKRRHHGSGVTLGKVLACAVVLGSVAETDKGPLGGTIYNWVQKLPGVKTFGGATTTALYLGALSKVLGKHGRGRVAPWLRSAGLVGVVGAGLKLGTGGTSFKWLGGYDSADPRMDFNAR